MTQPQEVKTVLGWEVDESSRKRVERALKDFRKAAKDGLDDKVVDQFGKRFGKLAKDIGLPGDAIDKLSQEVLDLGGNLDHITKFSDAFLKVEKNAERAGKEVRELSKIELRQQQFDAVSRNVGLAGDVQSNLGALNALSGGSIGPVGEVFALIEELPRLKTALAGLPQTIAQAAATLGPAGLAVGVALAAVGLAVAEFARQSQERADALAATVEANRDIAKQVAQGATSDELRERQEEINRLREAELAELERTQNAYNTLIDGFDQMGLATLSKVFSAEEEALAASIADINKTVSGLNSEYDAITRALGDNEIAANDAVKSEEELAASREQAASAAQQLAQLERQAVDLRASYDQSAGDRLVDELNRRKDAREDAYRAEQQRAKQFNSAIEKAKEASNKRLAKLEDELNNLPRKRAQELREAETEAQEERIKVLQEYASESTDAAEDLARELNKITASGEKERRRILEDSADSINEAAAQGDVESFLRAERERDKAISRSLEDQNDAAKERADDFAVEREREREALQKRLADIQSGLQKEQQAIRDSYAQRRDEIKTAIDEEKAAIKAYVDESTAAFLQREREIEEERRRQQQRRERDEAIAESRRQRDFNQQLTNLQQQANAITSVTYSTRELQAAARSLQAALASVRAGSAAAARNSRRTPPRNSSSGSSGGRGASGPRFSAFASGGVIDELTYAQMGEDARRGVYEAVIPFRKSEGIGPALDRMGIGGGSREQFVFNITGQFTVGDIASKSEVSATFNEFGQEIVGKVMGAVRNARRNSGRVA